MSKTKTIYDLLNEWEARNSLSSGLCNCGLIQAIGDLWQWLDDAAKDKLASDAEAVAKTQKAQCSHSWGTWQTMPDLHKERMCNICGKRQKQIEDYTVNWAAWTDSLCTAAGWKRYERRCMQCDAKETCTM